MRKRNRLGFCCLHPTIRSPASNELLSHLLKQDVGENWPKGKCFDGGGGGEGGGGRGDWWVGVVLVVEEEELGGGGRGKVKGLERWW